jgi:hypothetical protein
MSEVYTTFWWGGNLRAHPRTTHVTELGGELHSVCEAENRVVIPMKKLYTPCGVESLVNDRGACFYRIGCD